MKTSHEPPIIIFRDDLDRLRGFLLTSKLSPAANYLANELERAEIVELITDADAVVRLGSHVRFKDSTRLDT